jgi:hypothetical protein
MPHVVLLGDSIFDNASYVPGHPPVIDQLRRELPSGWQATLLAVDGHVTTDVQRQLARLPADATHMAVSVGGNDALRASGILGQPVTTIAEAMSALADIQAGFRREYQSMLETVLSRRLPTVVCTIYDAIPGLEAAAVAALSLFNDAILREAINERVPVLDLRLVCSAASDYSPLSPIEPSHLGGRKIAVGLARVFVEHGFAGPAAIYGS